VGGGCKKCRPFLRGTEEVIFFLSHREGKKGSRKGHGRTKGCRERKSIMYQPVHRVARNLIMVWGKRAREGGERDWNGSQEKEKKRRYA